MKKLRNIMNLIPLKEGTDIVRIDHLRKEIFIRKLYGDLANGFIGNVSYDKALKSPSKLVAEVEQMSLFGRYLFGFFAGNEGDRVVITVEKYLLKKRLLMDKIGFRVGIRNEFKEANNTTEGFLVSKSLVDISTRVFGIIVLHEEAAFLNDQSSLIALSGI